MPSFRRRGSVIDAEGVDEPPRSPATAEPDADEALALAEEAEAEAAEAEALAAAARARARAIRLRRQASTAAGQASGEIESTAADEHSSATDDETESAAEDQHPAEDVAEPIDATETDSDGKADPPGEVADKQSAHRRRRRSAGRILKVLAAAVAVIATIALITLSVLMVLQHRHVEQDQRLNAEYSAAARQSVVTLMSLDFNKAKEDVQRIIDNSTGQFKDDFQKQAEDFVKVAQDAKVITEVTVNATGVQSMTKDTATVLVSATSRVTNSSGAKQEPRSWRLAVDLQRDGGQVKMAKVEFVP